MPSLPLSQAVAIPGSRRSRPAFYLRNAVSFPPDSLTDRRTLTSETPNFAVSEVENLNPPIEDLLIISFEPTRKSTGVSEEIHLSGKIVIRDSYDRQIEMCTHFYKP